MKRLALILTGCLPLITSANAAEITIKGSDTMVVMAQRWAEEFMKENPGTSLQVTGGGSGTGIAALLNNTTDIALSSRPIKPKEAADFVVAFGAKPVETKTSLDGLAVFVHESNPLTSLTIPQLSSIFRGEITNFKEVGGPDLAITLYSRENNSGTYAYFKEHVLKDKDFAATAQNMSGTAALINAIGKDPSAIGYGGIGFGTGTKHISIKTDSGKDVDAVMDKVISGEYPLSRYLLTYTNPANKKPEVKKFLEWIGGPKGQGLVAQAGYFPLPGAQVASMQASTQPATPQPAAAKVAPMTASTTPTSAPVVAVSSPMVNPNAPDVLRVSEREMFVMKRELAIAERELAVAMREMKVAEREGNAAEREYAVSELTSGKKRR